MQDLVSEFSKIFRGLYPGPSQRERATPSRTQHPARSLAGRGALGTQTLVPLNFSAVVAPLVLTTLVYDDGRAVFSLS